MHETDFFILVAICINLKPFVFWDVFVLVFHYDKTKLLSMDTLADLSLLSAYVKM